MTLRHVLVAMDFGDAAMAALDVARDCARSAGATIHLVHVVDDVLSRRRVIDGPPPDFGRLQTELEDDARQKLTTVADELNADGVSARAAIVTSPRPAAALLDYARDAKVDLIVAGTHGRSGFADLFMGSVAQQLVRTAHCPVLTVRQPAVQHPVAVLAGRA